MAQCQPIIICTWCNSVPLVCGSVLRIFSDSYVRQMSGNTLSHFTAQIAMPYQYHYILLVVCPRYIYSYVVHDLQLENGHWSGCFCGPIGCLLAFSGQCLRSSSQSRGNLWKIQSHLVHSVILSDVKLPNPEVEVGNNSADMSIYQALWTLFT